MLNAATVTFNESPFNSAHQRPDVRLHPSWQSVAISLASWKNLLTAERTTGFR